ASSPTAPKQHRLSRPRRSEEHPPNRTAVAGHRLDPCPGRNPCSDQDAPDSARERSRPRQPRPSTGDPSSPGTDRPAALNLPPSEAGSPPADHPVSELTMPPPVADNSNHYLSVAATALLVVADAQPQHVGVYLYCTQAADLLRTAGARLPARREADGTVGHADSE